MMQDIHRSLIGSRYSRRVWFRCYRRDCTNCYCSGLILYRYLIVYGQQEEYQEQP